MPLVCVAGPGSRYYSTSSSDWQLETGHFVDAKMAMVAVAPRAGLNTQNIYYLAYPGIRYQRPVAILGGARPLHFEKQAGPADLAINADTGVMTWENPTTSGSPHSVTIRVYDQEHGRPSDSYIDISFSITVQTSGFVFIDEVNGSDANAGTLASPKQTAAAIGGTASTDVVVLRNNTTLVWDSDYNDNARRIMAYPGEFASLDFSSEQIASAGDVATNRAFIGLTLIPKSSTSGGTAIIDWPSGATDILVYGNTITDPGGTDAPGTNPALFFSGNNSPSWTEYIAFVDNDIQGTGFSSVFLGYSTRYLVAERNTLGNSDLHGWSAKIRNQYWTIAGNTGIATNTSELFNASDYDITDSIEVCWNNYSTSGNGMLFELGNGDTETGPTNIWSYRNTWQMDHHQVHWDPVGMTVENDVIEYTTAAADPHGWVWSNTADVGSYSGEECVGRGVNIVDANGLLTGTYRTNYLGLRGHEVA